MSEKGPHPDQEDESADDQAKREEVRREEEAGVRYPPADVFRELDKQAETLAGGKTAGEKKVLTNQPEQRADDALTEALEAGSKLSKMREQEESLVNETFFSLEQRLRPVTQIEMIADDSADERNLVGVLGACRQVGKGILERERDLSFSDRATFKQAAKLLLDAETRHLLALRAFRQHLLEKNQDEAVNDFELFRENILGPLLETATTQWRVLERIKFSLDRKSIR